jgi:hypothetical protein
VRDFFPPALGQKLGAKKREKNWGKREKQPFWFFFGGRKKTKKLGKKKLLCPNANYRTAS